MTRAPSATLTETPTATRTPSVTPTPSATASATAIGGCSPPPGWEPYTIRSGDTLFSISRRYQTTVLALRQANCLTSDLIYAGRTLYVPAPGGDSCSDPKARITAPQYDAQVSGRFWVDGAAAIRNFDHYEIEVQRDGSETWLSQGTYYTPVSSGHLARIDPAQFGSGVFWLRLTVVDEAGDSPPPCTFHPPPV
ncbi:MAG: LysM peptidoglycan-binding domain-containing protein [Anaerolineae bacterium]|nr:LysM peptidoglycan-binding domain-containing protein [Anaerolineae bacterium]